MSADDRGRLDSSVPRYTDSVHRVGNATPTDKTNERTNERITHVYLDPPVSQRARTAEEVDESRESKSPYCCDQCRREERT
jgi:hypothetical protein